MSAAENGGKQGAAKPPSTLEDVCKMVEKGERRVGCRPLLVEKRVEETKKKEDPNRR